MTVDLHDPADARSEARAMASGGDLEGAVELLVRANRERQDPEVEALLVRLRIEAGRARAAAARRGHTAWPPPAPAVEPGPWGVPEVPADRLDADVLAGAVAGHGCLLVRGLVDPATASSLIEVVDRAFEASDAEREGAPVADTRPWYDPAGAEPGTSVLGAVRAWSRETGGVGTVDSPRAFFAVTEALARTPLVPVVADYLGEPPVLSAEKCTLRRVPLELLRSVWHQDGAFLGTEVRTVNLWLALTECGSGTDAAGLDLVPARLDHIVPTGTGDADFSWSVGQQEVDALEGAPAPVRPRFGPGDALLFDQMLLHRGGVAAGPADPPPDAPLLGRQRYAVESWFFAPSSYPADATLVAI